MEDVQEVEVTFRLRPAERILYSLLFWRYYRMLALIGLVSLAFSAVPALDTGRLVALTVGLMFVCSFVWLPFVSKPRPVERSFRATRDSLVTYVEECGGGPVEWRSFRRTRHRAGVLLLELRGGLVIFIPLRAFEPAQLAAFEAIAARGIADPSLAASIPTDAGEPLLRFRYQVGLRELVINRALEFNARRELVIGAALVVLGVILAQSDPISNGGVASYLVVFGSVWIVLPWALPIVNVILSGPHRWKAQPAEIVVYRTGYYVEGLAVAAWSAWSAFGSVKERRDELVLQLGTSRNHIDLSIRALSGPERKTLRAIIADAALMGPTEPDTAGA